MINLIILLVLGFLLLIKGADFFVTGASSIARYFKIPSLVIGLTIVSIGTSAPEASVSITAGLSGSNEMALANVLGSNIFNIAVVLGICAIIKPITASKQIVRNEFPFMVFSSVITLVLIYNLSISQFDGLILLVFFALFMAYVVIFAIKNKTETPEEYVKPNILKSTILSLVGVVGIIFGGDLVVNAASDIALSFNLSENLIGLTIVAVGTSLPELVTSLVAAKKGESDIALGNVIGSNIFNLLFILGLSATITPMVVNINSIYDSVILILISLFVFIVSKMRGGVSKLNGYILISSYILFTIYIIMR